MKELYILYLPAWYLLYNRSHVQSKNNYIPDVFQRKFYMIILQKMSIQL